MYHIMCLFFKKEWMILGNDTDKKDRVWDLHTFGSGTPVAAPELSAPNGTAGGVDGGGWG